MKLTTKNLTHFLLIGVVACAVALAGGNALAADAKPNPITAIDILLEPDATMIEHATATNERLLKVFPKGFALDASHRPHITLVQRFVLTENLDKVYAAVGKVFASANVTGLKLEAFKYYYIPDKDLGVSGIVIKPTPELLTLEKQVIDAVTPFAVKTGTSAAFVTTPEDPPVRGENRNLCRIRHHARRPKHHPALNRLRFGVRAEAFRRELPSARHHRPRPADLPRRNAQGTV